jgi:hypothetical protein
MTELRTTAGLAESHVWGGSCKTKYEWYRRRLASNELETSLARVRNPVSVYGTGGCQKIPIINSLYHFDVSGLQHRPSLSPAGWTAAGFRRHSVDTWKTQLLSTLPCMFLATRVTIFLGENLTVSASILLRRPGMTTVLFVINPR